MANAFKRKKRSEIPGDKAEAIHIGLFDPANGTHISLSGLPTAGMLTDIIDLPNAVEYTAERDGWVFVSPYGANVSVKAAGIAVNRFLVDYFANKYLRTIKAPVATGDRVQIAVGPPEAWSCVFYPFIRGSG